MQLNKEKVLILLAGLAMGSWIGVLLFTPKIENTTTTIEKITYDTVWVNVDTVFSQVATKAKPIKPKDTRPKDPDKDPQPEKYDSIRYYSGTNSFEYGKLDWKISTGGVLQSYEFKPQFEIPTVTIEKEKTLTETKTIIQRGLFAGGGMNSRGSFHSGATYLGNNFLIEYNFSPAKQVQTHQIGFKVKVF